ncbi:MAG: hypothetical protein ACYC3X_04585 [Pirellulaceae bacterium]
MARQKYCWAVWMVLAGTLMPSTATGQERMESTSIGEPPGYFSVAQAPTPAAVAAPAGKEGWQLPPLAKLDAPAAPLGDDMVVVSAEKFKLAEPWKLGDYKLVPYGALWADMIYATERTNPGAYTLYVPSPASEGESAFTIDERRTRLGFNLTGPDVDCFGGAKTGGQVEIDFFGQFINENQAGILLRHAYWEAKNDEWRMLVGQNWDVISPLYPNMVNYSVGWAGGNIGYRRPQFRWERYLDFSPTSLGILQLSLNQDIVPDFATDTTIDREPASWPVVESRIAWKWGERDEKCLPWETGISGHIGSTGFDFRGVGPAPGLLPPEDDRTFRTWSLNVDVKAPINESCGIQGEFYTGANLSPFLGGIGQGVCPCLRVPIRDTGGWAEFWYDWNSQLHSHAGFGLDDPNDNDFLVGRSYNSFVFTNLMYDITKKFSTGFEVSYWKTSYVDRRPIPLGPLEQGNSVTLDWMFKYGF